MKKRTVGRKYHRGKYWIQQRDKSFERANHKCEITGDALIGENIGFIDDQPIFRWARACHHVIAERAARRIVPGCDPHCDGNLVTITPSLHAKITAAERKLHCVDIVGYKQALNKLGVPPELFDRALSALCASVKR